MRHALSLGVLLVVTAFGCGRTTAPEGSESHFLDTCTDTTCGPGLSCICGTCTRTCTTSDDCSSLASGSTCVEIADLPSTQNCSTSAVQPVCDVACSADVDCATAGSDLRCIDGVCRRIVPDQCTLPKDSGPCFAAEAMYWHDPATHRCESFTYGGCDGNANRFATLAECEQTCNVVSSSSNTPDAGSTTCDDVQNAIAASVRDAQNSSNTACASAADCTVVALDNACHHGCSSTPVSDPTTIQTALNDAEATWCPTSAALGCTPLVPPCPPPAQIDCAHTVCVNHGECPLTCQCDGWNQSALHDRSGCSGSDLYVATTAGCVNCGPGEAYVAIVNRGQTDFSGVVTITMVNPDASAASILPFSQTLSIPSGDFVGVTVTNSSADGLTRLRLSADGDCDTTNDEFDVTFTFTLCSR